MEKELLEKYLLEGKTHREIAELTGMSKSNIGYWVTKFGINDLAKYAKPQYIDPKMFNKIDTREKAYILGYSLADAYITKDGIEFGCEIRDKEILNFIQQIIGGNVREDLSLNKQTRRFPRARMNIGNRDLVVDFNKHGSSKEDKRFPIISKELERFLVLGFFDGDGCITWGVRKDRNRIWQKVSFTASYKLLEGLQKILEKHCEIASSIKPKGKENCFVLEFSSQKAVLKFLDFIYPDNNFYILKRKYIKAQALRLELGEFGEDPRTPSEATEEIAVERVETSGRGNDKTAIAPEH